MRQVISVHDESLYNSIHHVLQSKNTDSRRKSLQHKQG